MKLLACIGVLLVCSSFAAATPAPGTLERVTKQQILASIPPGGAGPVLFLTSPSGKYAAYFVRTHTVPGAGGLGADFCYVQVQVVDTHHSGGAGEGGGASVWESECRPISTVNTCALLFSWDGLEVFDGAEEVWHGETNSDGTNFLETLELVDDGDMRIRDKDGELAWRASDEPRHAQRCGAPGSPGLATALPPFAEPIGAHSSDLPFGLEPDGNGHAATELPASGAGDLPQAADVEDDDGAAAPAAGNDDAATAGFGGGAAGIGQGGEHDAAAAVGFGNQPLVDNSPFDSGTSMDGRGVHLAAIGVALCVSALLGAMGAGI
ncbi:hypothetical protein PR202_gb07715 [Eleusine coracana subsp. coracana]|uniref:non-specific serine/threonine protein kinase n=1 Tax=Eleusine coracana subsp. coracana TaxID=191504 RepID=A0AAV5ECZ0_ELECO|nr:hypothetical protein QOZ80_2BG0174540 [Eleusine coracana subsp. coracana]GJN20346.1 hypothetical protein PR202_gb07715 [Eleusine coracana subsp. coracana]